VVTYTVFVMNLFIAPSVQTVVTDRVDFKYIHLRFFLSL
jgi:hypothetical protein